jgi:hypothetical protein
MAAEFPLKVFVSSPVYGIEDYRTQALRLAQVMNPRGRYDVFLFENHIIKMDRTKTISQNILALFGARCDAFIVFFKDRIGNGTREEIEHFKSFFSVENPKCKLWWVQISGGTHDQQVSDLIQNLYEIGIQMPAAHSAVLDSPEELGWRMTTVLTEVAFSAMDA